MRHYHTDNGQFTDHAFINDAVKEDQRASHTAGQRTLTKRHYQAVVEKSTAIMHVGTRWKGVVNTHVWPYALRAANNPMNLTLLLKTCKIPIQTFRGTDAQPVLRHFHPFWWQSCLCTKLEVGSWTINPKVAQACSIRDLPGTVTDAPIDCSGCWASIWGSSCPSFTLLFMTTLKRSGSTPIMPIS